MDDARLAETVDYVAIRRLQSAYADVCTRRAWAEFDGLFLPDAVVEVDRRVGEPLRFVGPHAIGDFIATAIAGMDFFEFVVLNTRVEIGIGGDPDAAAARMYMQELRHETESGRFTIVYGVYHDRLARAGGHWWFEHRRYHSLTRNASPDGGRDDGSWDVFEFPHHLRLDEL
jgi:hypothetical protein